MSEHVDHLAAPLMPGLSGGHISKRGAPKTAGAGGFPLVRPKSALFPCAGNTLRT